MPLTKQQVRNKIFPEIFSLGGRVSQASSGYKVLYQLAKCKFISMNGSAKRIVILCKVKPSFVESLANKILAEYVETGSLDIPPEFKMKGRY